ncbi:unnamed protein product [Bursaphelenchus xylophilus]|uniref:(pine wood nematode) hypothetical protein n=1 Tax=Bursaphelenchus xylophilus TaxID=6326 RepID=A0A1I7S867_BURXY|nr:unnamed protein product [Bursaphelenchus xylophilus]CAG9080516.1 unnamed protein product [Bursaphelenchus xylophilus]
MEIKYLLVAVLVFSLVTTADAGILDWIWRGGKWILRKIFGRGSHTVVVQQPPPPQPIPMMPQQYDPQYGR